MERICTSRWRGGFTLIEMMVVVAIIGLLAAVVTVNVIDRWKRAKVTTAKGQIAILATAVEAFMMDNEFYPSTEQGLEALVTKPATGKIPGEYPKSGYLKKDKVPEDPWGNPYIYRSPAPSGFDYEIISLGADGIEGGEDDNADIVSWKTD